MPDLGSLHSQLTEEINAIRLRASEKAKEVAKAVLEVAIENTNVDTSKAVSNWQVSLDTPKESAIGAYFKGEDGSTFEASVSAAKKIGAGILRSKKPGQDIYITNNSYLEPDKGRPAPNEPKDYLARSEILLAESEAVTAGIILAAAGEALLRDI